MGIRTLLQMDGTRLAELAQDGGRVKLHDEDGELLLDGFLRLARGESDWASGTVVELHIAPVREDTSS